MGGEYFGPVVACCVASAMLTGVLALNAAALGKLAGLVDRPDGVRKLHKDDTPLVGGLALLIPAFVVSLVYFAAVSRMPFVPLAMVASAVLLFIGILDDRMGISPVWRLVAMTFIIFSVFSLEPLFILHTLKFGFRRWQFSVPLGIVAAPITALIILGFVNAANMADGMNGQLMGSVVVWCLFIAYHVGAQAAVPFLVVACSAIVTIGFNLRGRLFAGNSGAYAASLFVALGAIGAYRLQDGNLPAQLPLLWFWLPVIDCMRLMVKRTRAGMSPLTGDRQHFHHLLLDHMRVRYALLVYLGLLAAPGVAIEFNHYLGAAVGILSLAIYVSLLVGLQTRASQSPASTNAIVPVLRVAQPPRPYWRPAQHIADREPVTAKAVEHQEIA